MADAAVVTVYFLLLCAVGLRSGRARGLGEFSRTRVSPFALTATLSASFLGGGFCMGNAAACAEEGIGPALALCGFSLSWGVLALLLPRMRFPRGAASAGDIMGAAYGEGSRIATGVFSFMLCAGIVGAQVGALGNLLQAFLGLPRPVGVLLGACVALLYSTLGGFGAVVRADCVQFCVLALGMPLLCLLCLRHAGGLSALPAHALTPRLSPALAGTFFAMALGEVLTPPGLQRLLIAGRGAQRPVALTAALSLPFFAIGAVVGLCAAKLLPAAQLPTAMENMIALCAPAGVRGLLIAAVLAAVLSTADSYLNSASISLVCDVLRPLWPSMSDRTGLAAVRAANLGAGLAAAAVALIFPSVLSAVTFSYAFWAPVLLVPLGGALLCPRPDPASCRAAALTGGLAALLWRFLLREPLGISCVPVGFALSLAAFCLTAKKARPPRGDRA